MALATFPVMDNSDPALCTQLVDVIRCQWEEVQYCVKSVYHCISYCNCCVCRKMNAVVEKMHDYTQKTATTQEALLRNKTLKVLLMTKNR